jgi:hypothetical protein
MPRSAKSSDAPGHRAASERSFATAVSIAGRRLGLLFLMRLAGPVVPLAADIRVQRSLGVGVHRL